MNPTPKTNTDETEVMAPASVGITPNCAAPVAAQARPDPRTPADMFVNGGALKLALNALRRAGKNEIADELEKTAAPAQQPVSGADVADSKQRILDAAQMWADARDLGPSAAKEKWNAFGLRVQAELAITATIAEDALPIELSGVSETAAEGNGIWRSCSGCHELNEGHDTGPRSKVLGCALGNGCSECGGIGAVWDTTDYAAMGDALAASMARPQPSGNAAPDDAMERALAELVDKIAPGLDTGDLVADAATASKALDRGQPSGNAGQLGSGKIDPMEILRNPLSQWGMLMRGLRCVSGTTLMDMSKCTGKTPAELSNFEFGRASPDDRMIEQVKNFFYERGAPVALDLLVKAARAAAKGEA